MTWKVLGLIAGLTLTTGLNFAAFAANNPQAVSNAMKKEQSGDTMSKPSDTMNCQSNAMTRSSGNTMSRPGNMMSQTGNTMSRPGNMMSQTGNTMSRPGNMMSQTGNTMTCRGDAMMKDPAATNH